jgi:hypothetical protein
MSTDFWAALRGVPKQLAPGCGSEFGFGWRPVVVQVTVIDPVMFGWIEQMYLYVPAFENV